jgi:hypothetical protein
LYSTACSNATAAPAAVWRQAGERVGRNRFIAPLARSRSRFFGRDRNSRPFACNVQHVMSGERRNKPIERYELRSGEAADPRSGERYKSVDPTTAFAF